MTHYQLVSSNIWKSWFVVLGFTLFITGAAATMVYGLGYSPDVLFLALTTSVVMSFSSYWWSDTVILGISGARPATRAEYFDFYTVTENLAHSQHLPLPKLYVIDDTAMNAFATGRDPKHAAVVVTTGLLSRLSRYELEGVIAHELSHVKNYDIRLMSIVTVLVGMIALLSDWLIRMSAFGRSSSREERSDGQLGPILFIVGIILALLSPLVAQLIQLAVSRRREFLADASGVAMTKNPEALVRALQKISSDTEPLEAANKATAHLYIANPLKNRHDTIGWFSGLFATHPPVEKRIAALRALTE